MSEGEVRANANALDLAKIRGKTANKRFAALHAEFAIKVEQEQHVCSHGFNRAKLLRQRIDQGRNMIGRDDSVGMAIEGDDYRNGLMLARIRDCLPDDLLMPEMDAVEKTDGKADLSPCGFKFV